MKSNGQLSIDLMMAVLAVLVFVQMFNPIMEQFTDSSKETAVFNQEKAIALKAMKVIGTATIIYDTYRGGTGSISFTTPLIYEPGRPSGQGCEIKILPLGSTECTTTGNKCITVNYTMKTGSGTKDVNYVADFNTMPDAWVGGGKTFECGETIEFSW